LREEHGIRIPRVIRLKKLDGNRVRLTVGPLRMARDMQRESAREIARAHAANTTVGDEISIDDMRKRDVAAARRFVDYQAWTQVQEEEDRYEKEDRYGTRRRRKKIKT
jgi:hypothetical protein